MNKENYPFYSSDINKALYQTLIKRIPPKKNSPHLEDIVNTLMKELSRGELKLNLNNNFYQTELKNPGWPQSHKKALLESGWLSGETAPLVLEKNQLSWRRWYNEMNNVIEELLTRSNLKYVRSNNPAQKEISPLEEILSKDQQIAVKAVDSRGIILLSGGPGTGKTSTIIEMIKRALYTNHNLNIGLAAPTGKAARRLQESLQKGSTTITSPHQKNLSQIPCQTLHRLLQATPNGFERNVHNPLNLDLLVVDEMSMVDLSLMKPLLDALPKSSQLILVGDHNQLPPIGSGAIWHRLQEKDMRIHFDKGAIHLQKLYRNRGELALLSKILCEKGLDLFWDHLSKLPDSANIQTHQSKLSTIPTFLINRLQQYSHRLEKLTKLVSKKLPKNYHPSFSGNINLGSEAKELFDCLEELMVLCPKKYGLWGVEEIHKALLGNNLEKDLSDWPQGTPVMCSENQHELQLSNGDIGIVIGEKGNRRLIFRLFSEKGNLTTKFIHPARLKAIKPAFAMTIHKAQGSEANEVILLLPEQPSASLQAKESEIEDKCYEERLIYTAITRARKRVDILIKS